MMHQCRFINKRTTLMGMLIMVEAKGARAGIIWEISVSSKFRYEPKTILQKHLLEKKKKKSKVAHTEGFIS